MSGRCLVSSASLGGRDIILVQLGGTHRMLFDDAQRLLLWGLGQQGGVPVSNMYSKSSYPVDSIGQTSWPDSR
jgi:D-alanyl-D-alanine carboxypeptidase